MSRSTNRVFTKYPWLFFALAIFLVANNFFNWFPHQVLNGLAKYIVPGALIGFGAMAYLRKWYEARKSDQENGRG